MDMSLEDLRATIPEYARDLRLNLGSVLTVAGAPGLNEAQIWVIALSAALAARNARFARQIEALAAGLLQPAQLQAAHAAAAIMGMNNVYYRFLHLVEDEEYRRMPARLRMNVLASPGIDKVDFELAALAVSTINACGMCITAHEQTLRQHGVTREQVHSTVRIAATIHAVAGVLEQQLAA
jgi:alkyl hydroperoxide reductase subunit D